MIGVATIKALLAQDVEIIAIYKSGSKKADRLPDDDRIRRIACNLEELGNLTKLLPLMGIELPKADVFYHFAWGHTQRQDRDNEELQIRNVVYTLDAVRLAHSVGCHTFIASGSQAEYGIVQGPITTDMDCNPVTAYGKSKLEAGIQARKLCDELGMTCIWGRVFSVYGTNDTPNSVISYAIQQYQNHEPAAFSAATQTWNFLYEDDCGELFAALGMKACEELASGVYNIANRKSRMLREYLTELAQELGEGFEYSFAEPDKAAELKPVVSLDPDTTKTYELVGSGYKNIDFRAGIKKVINSKI